MILAILACLELRKRASRNVRLKTDLEAVGVCQFEPEVHSAMSDHNSQRQRHETTTVEAKKDSTVLTGETLHGAELTLQSTTEMSPQHAKHKPFLPCRCLCVR